MFTEYKTSRLFLPLLPVEFPTSKPISTWIQDCPSNLIHFFKGLYLHMCEQIHFYTPDL